MGMNNSSWLSVILLWALHFNFRLWHTKEEYRERSSVKCPLRTQVRCKWPCRPLRNKNCFSSLTSLSTHHIAYLHCNCLPLHALKKSCWCPSRRKNFPQGNYFRLDTNIGRGCIAQDNCFAITSPHLLCLQQTC